MNIAKASIAFLMCCISNLPLCAQESTPDTAQTSCRAHINMTVSDLIEGFNRNAKKNHFKVKMKKFSPIISVNCNPDFNYFDLGVGREVAAIATVPKTGDDHVDSIYIGFFPDAAARGTANSIHFDKNYTDMVATIFQTLEGDKAHEPETYLNKLRMHPSLSMPDALSPDHVLGRHWIHSTFWNANSNSHCQARISRLPVYADPSVFTASLFDSNDNRPRHGFANCGRELDFGLSKEQFEQRFDKLAADHNCPIRLQSYLSPHELCQNFLVSPRYPVTPGIIGSATGRFATGECGHLTGFGLDTLPPRTQGGHHFKISFRRFLQIASYMLESACPQFGPKQKAEIFSSLQMTELGDRRTETIPNTEKRLVIGDIHFYFGATNKPEGQYLQFSVTRIPANPVMGE